MFRVFYFFLHLPKKKRIFWLPRCKESARAREAREEKKNHTRIQWIYLYTHIYIYYYVIRVYIEETFSFLEYASITAGWLTGWLTGCCSLNVSDLLFVRSLVLPAALLCMSFVAVCLCLCVCDNMCWCVYMCVLHSVRERQELSVGHCTYVRTYIYIFEDSHTHRVHNVAHSLSFRSYVSSMHVDVCSE